MRCPRCAFEYPRAPRCPRCGAPAPPPGAGFLGPISLALLALFLVLVVSDLVALGQASGDIAAGIQAADPQGCTGTLGLGREPCFGYILAISPLPLPAGQGYWGVAFALALFEGPGLLAWFVIIVVAVVGSCAWLTGRDAWRLMVRSPRPGRPSGWLPRSWTGVARVFAAVWAFENIYFIVILPLLGIQPESPFPQGEAPWYLPFVFVQASVAEELMARGLVLALLVAVLELDAGARRRRPWDYVLGGGYALEARTLLPLVYSSVLFALAHVLGGPGAWGTWKFVDTFVAGLALGYLFLRYGLAASILLHFSINYFPDFLDFGPISGTLWSGSVAVLGGIVALLFILDLARRLPQLLRWRPSAVVPGAWALPPTPPPPPSAVPPFVGGPPPGGGNL